VGDAAAVARCVRCGAERCGPAVTLRTDAVRSRRPSCRAV
jgi:hypothetical protein